MEAAIPPRKLLHKPLTQRNVVRPTIFSSKLSESSPMVNWLGGRQPLN